MKDYRKLRVWQKGIEIVKLTYKLTSALPSNEKFNLVSQMNRAAVSIPSNIAEGSSRKSEKDYHRYLEISLGSCFELDTQIEIVIQLEFDQDDLCDELRTSLIEEIMMLQSLMNKLKK
ncbi:four helix bundle protein [Carboxylicivirga caseinilyticus]|uniref:four helix bundle protein n=1 Tax=Carboxylicivirga caseinilyticus TaxID=3417572 RepID=UPI003D33CB90|nr:four helix bundle protein [Marinilabiliaceae bacterium A049]